MDDATLLKKRSLVVKLFFSSKSRKSKWKELGYQQEKYYKSVLMSNVKSELAFLSIRTQLQNGRNVREQNSINPNGATFLRYNRLVGY